MQLLAIKAICFHIIIHKFGRYANTLQNEPILSKQKFKIVKITQIIDLVFFGHRIQEQLLLYRR